MKIEFIQPYAFDGYIGREYNRVLELLPDDSWVCITDHDTLKPPGFADRVAHVLRDHGRPDRLFGAMTNRVGWKNRAVIQPMYAERDISEHLITAKRIWNENKTDLIHIDIVCGYTMVFHKSLWKSMGGFLDRTIVFDKQISAHASECWLMAGVYIVHLYRWGMQNPELRHAHLTQPGKYLK